MLYYYMFVIFKNITALTLVLIATINFLTNITKM